MVKGEQALGGDDPRWSRRLEAVAEHVARTGHLPSMAKGVGSQERSLGYWVNNQRRAHSIGLLKGNRVARLDAAVPIWYDSFQHRAPRSNG
ncbi:hypothetical protein GIS00_12085 [Nakamurella sp. YIM 132087]|uniref:Helicase-associated domain-containing protein n=1 Tax=Nakamurella alba TaxID=2665158 RepID=A0A7K1FKL0_9ACTN|nr:hypothetical protein [Nakamurella alba]